jgi:hypothetical protein
MHLLFWRAIEDAKQDGLSVFDFGRSDWENRGLITFKDRWGANRSALTYSRFSVSSNPIPVFRSEHGGWNRRAAAKLIRYLPDGIFRLAGRLIYRHLG